MHGIFSHWLSFAATAVGLSVNWHSERDLSARSQSADDCSWEYLGSEAEGYYDWDLERVNDACHQCLHQARLSCCHYLANVRRLLVEGDFQSERQLSHRCHWKPSR